MTLREALLCVDCEWLYAESAHCPRCGSRVAYPLARAMNQDDSAVGGFLAPRRAPARRPRRHLVFAG